MKGFFIQVTNNLLEPKHRERMGTSVWEFMWCLDKITKIDDQGIGWVLGGKPINIKDITSEVGGGDRQVRINMNTLEEHGYIIKQRTPYGIRIWVAKAKKQFKRRDRQDLVERSAGLCRSNIRHIQDINNNENSKKSFPLKKHMDYEEVDEDGNPIQKSKWPKRPAKGPKPEGRNKIALRIQHKFVELCKKEVGVMPIMDVKGYKIVLHAMSAGNLSEEQIYDLFDEWFGLGKPDEETVQITRALSTNQVNAYKARNGISEKPTADSGD